MHPLYHRQSCLSSCEMAERFDLYEATRSLLEKPLLFNKDLVEHLLPNTLRNSDKRDQIKLQEILYKFLSKAIGLGEGSVKL